MKGMNKIKLLKEILGDSDLIKSKILKEEPESEGMLTVKAKGDSPEDAKEMILEKLGTMKLPDEEEMKKMEEKMIPEEEMEDEEEMELDEEEMELDEDMLDQEDKDVLEMLPEATKEQFKKKLLEKIKNM